MVLVAALFVAPLLSGCSIDPATAHEITPTGTFSENLDATQVLVGDDWQVRDDSTARSCALPGGGTGTTTSALRISVLVAPDAQAKTAPSAAVATAAVASAWTQWGYTVTENVSQTSIGEVAQVQATRADGEYLIFRASAAALTVQGESACKSTP